MNNQKIPTHWELKKLGEVCKLKNGYAFKSDNYENSGIPVIRISDINGGVVSSEKAVRVKANAEFENYLVENNDILVAMSGATTGKFGIYKSDEKAYQNQRVGKFKILDETILNNDFLFHQINSLKRRIEKDAYGGAQPNISSTKIEQMQIVIPPLPEQQAIVNKIEELLSELENGIQQLLTVQRHLKVYRQSLLKWAFEGKLTQINVKDGELPKGWKWVKMESLLFDKKKGMATGPFGTMLKKSEHQPNGIPVLGIENIGEGVFQMPNKIFVTNEKALELKNFLVKENDIIISRSGTVGEICLLPKKMENSIISTNLIRVRLNQNVINSKFFVYLFQGGKVRQQVFELCKGSSRAFLNQTILNSLDFPLCSLEDQQSIVSDLDNKVTFCDKIEETINQSLHQAETLRQSILKKAFEGKLNL
jgi:type I restriction enzyme S subunit